MINCHLFTHVRSEHRSALGRLTVKDLSHHQRYAASQELTPSQDQVICAVTDGQGAPNQPARTKITRIVVSDVGQDQKVTLNVTAWEIPY
jgi:hypothetical protein